MAKKWYDLFVVTGEEKDLQAPTAASASESPVLKPAAEPSNFKRVVDFVSSSQEDVKFASPVENAVSLEEIYRSAQISSPVHGYSILKVAEMLQSEHIRLLPGDVKRKSIMVALDAAGVKVREIIEDAVHRDRALDTFERVLQKRLGDLGAQKEAENRRIEEDIQQKLAELRARMQENTKALSQEQENLKAWREKKQAEEARIAEAVSYFVAENPISTSAKPNRQSEKPTKTP